MGAGKSAKQFEGITSEQIGQALTKIGGDSKQLNALKQRFDILYMYDDGASTSDSKGLKRRRSSKKLEKQISTESLVHIPEFELLPY